MFKVYGTLKSGNCYKVKLLLDQLSRAYAWCEVDVMDGATRSEEFLHKNPNGRVPVLEIEPELFVPKPKAPAE